MKKVYAFVIGLTVLLLMAASAGAASESTSSAKFIDEAYLEANWPFQEYSGLMHGYLNASKNFEGTTRIRLSFFGSLAGKKHNYYTLGYVRLPDKDADWKINTNSVFLSATVPVYDRYTGRKEIITVDAKWTGTGANIDKQIPSDIPTDITVSKVKINEPLSAKAKGSISVGEEVGDLGTTSDAWFNTYGIIIPNNV
ncbi:MAG: hypothetical protein EHM20_04165 [Alphaproteobacteria bacterium]|nr:MAG: hypothetical protein EHM20_04165 [Alphaproteobacteria bacterium]